MPYPATPLYLQGAATWTLDASVLPIPSQMYILNGNVLAGCLTGSLPASNALRLTARDVNGNAIQTLTLTLPVVSLNQLDNGIVHINPAGSTALPPNSFQQGVIPPGQSNLVLFPATDQPSFGADAGFSGNFVFGFETAAPQVCNSSNASAVVVNSPSSPGRFDILYNGTTQSCPPSAIPSTPPALAFSSVDVIRSPVSFHGATASNVSIRRTSGTAIEPVASNVLDLVQSPSGTSIAVTLNFNYTVDLAGCNGTGCIVQIEYGLNTDSGPQGCAYNGGASPVMSGTSVSVNIPNQPGRYYVGIDKSLDFSCLQSTAGWWSGRPDISRSIAIVNVWGTPAP